MKIIYDVLFGNSPLTEYGSLRELAFTAINNEIPVVFGDMSESLYRMAIGEAFTLSNIKLIFAHLLESGKKVKKEENSKNINFWYLAFKEIPDLFLHAWDHFIASALYNS